jgi:hypothetical protein
MASRNTRSNSFVPGSGGTRLQRLNEASNRYRRVTDDPQPRSNGLVGHASASSTAQLPPSQVYHSGSCRSALGIHDGDAAHPRPTRAVERVVPPSPAESQPFIGVAQTGRVARAQQVNINKAIPDLPVDAAAASTAQLSSGRVLRNALDDRSAPSSSIAGGSSGPSPVTPLSSRYRDRANVAVPNRLVEAAPAQSLVRTNQRVAYTPVADIIEDYFGDSDTELVQAPINAHHQDQFAQASSMPAPQHPTLSPSNSWEDLYRAINRIGFLDDSGPSSSTPSPVVVNGPAAVTSPRTSIERTIVNNRPQAPPRLDSSGSYIYSDRGVVTNVLGGSPPRVANALPVPASPHRYPSVRSADEGLAELNARVPANSSRNSNSNRSSNRNSNRNSGFSTGSFNHLIGNPPHSRIYTKFLALRHPVQLYRRIVRPSPAQQKESPPPAPTSETRSHEVARRVRAHIPEAVLNALRSMRGTRGSGDLLRGGFQVSRLHSQAP